MGTLTVSFLLLGMDSGIVSMKQRVLLKDHVFSPAYLAVVAEILYSEADAIVPILNKMIYANLSARDAMMEVDTALGYAAS